LLAALISPSHVEYYTPGARKLAASPKNQLLEQALCALILCLKPKINRFEFMLFYSLQLSTYRLLL
jgi:hypothetical protein